MKEDKRSPEVADIFRSFGKNYQDKNVVTTEQYKVMHRIQICRTALLGGHIEGCDHCGHTQNAYNSCRDRHCPKCGTLTKEKWLNSRKAELLPCPYFHNVFTLPHELNDLILVNKRVMLALLFTAVKETLQIFAGDPQWRLVGQLGFISVLHTWNQKLMDHFHLHCIIPAGALSFDRKKWIAARRKYLFRVQSLAKEFRKRYLHKLVKAYGQNKLSLNGRATKYADQEQFAKLIETLRAKQWITYSKQPFGGPEQVFEYLGRYTHRVAITNNRIIAVNNGTVTFNYRDRSDGNTLKELTVTADEFIRRFLIHVLPSGFVKIRYFGFLAHANKKQCIPLLRNLIDPKAEQCEKLIETIEEMMMRLVGVDISLCPECGQGKMIQIEVLTVSPDTS